MPPRVQISSGSGSAFWANFGFGFHRVYKFQQSSGSGLSGFTSKVRVLGFIGFGFRFYKKMLTLNWITLFEIVFVVQNEIISISTFIICNICLKIERFWTKFGNYFSHLESIGYPRVWTSGSGLVGFDYFTKLRVRVCRASFSKFGFSGFRVPEAALVSSTKIFKSGAAQK